MFFCPCHDGALPGFKAAHAGDVYHAYKFRTWGSPVRSPACVGLQRSNIPLRIRGHVTLDKACKQKGALVSANVSSPRRIRRARPNTPRANARRCLYHPEWQRYPAKVPDHDKYLEVAQTENEKQPGPLVFVFWRATGWSNHTAFPFKHPRSRNQRFSSHFDWWWMDSQAWWASNWQLPFAPSHPTYTGSICHCQTSAPTWSE
jgi:hypothetical protein